MSKRLLILSLALLPLCAFAQFDTGDNIVQKPAWEQFKLPRKSVNLDFRNASPDAVIAFFSKASGVTIVKDPTLKEGLTIQSAKPVSLTDAFNILNTALGLRNFELKKQGNLMVIQAKQQRPAFDFSQMANALGGRQQNELKVYPIQFASATAVARTINEVFAADTSAQNNPFARFGGGGGRFGGGGGGFNNNQNQPNGGGAAGQQPTVHASSDDFSNSVIVNAPTKIQDQIADLLKQIDKQATEPFQSKVYKLQFASSDDLAPVVQNVLTANAPTGRGGATSQNTDFASRFQQAIRLGSTQASFGTVVSEPRTNSLIVTATPENQALVTQVVGELDKQIHFSDNAVVIPLSNARADQVAYLLNQAFQSRVANTNFGNFGATTGANRGTTNTNTSTTGGVPRLGGLNQTQNNGQLQASVDAQQAKLDQQAKELQLQLADPSLTAGELATNIVAQGGGAFRFLNQGGGNNSNPNAPTVSRDENGRLVNVHNLNGQVTVIPDVNSNSVIVVTNPENMSIIRNILDQLDRTPQQVMIETIIAEANIDDSDKLGVEWQFAQGKAFGNQGTNGVLSQNFGAQAANPTGFKYTLAGGNLNLFINALKTDSRFHILSTPRIFTSNNVQGQINISQAIPYVVSSQVDTNGNYNYSYQFMDVGVILTVTPRITASGYVGMDVTQTANDLQSYTSFNAPIVNQRQAQTTVSVKDGETIILGGIMRSTVSTTTNKIPLLGDIPLLGNLFKSTSHSKSKTELLVFLTPHIVSTAEDAQRLRQSQEKDLSKENRQGVDQIIKQHQIPTTPKEGGQQQ